MDLHEPPFTIPFSLLLLALARGSSKGFEDRILIIRGCGPREGGGEKRWWKARRKGTREPACIPPPSFPLMDCPPYPSLRRSKNLCYACLRPPSLSCAFLSPPSQRADWSRSGPRLQRPFDEETRYAFLEILGLVKTRLRGLLEGCVRTLVWGRGSNDGKAQSFP